MKIFTLVKNRLNLHLLDSKTKMGTLTGVYLPNILQMFGVILFMRLGWILSQTGFYKMLFIITMCSSILAITGLSMTSIVTNMKIGSGGTYYILSRSLGVRMGSAIGLLLCLAQITSIALCTSGFAVSIHELFPSLSIDVIKITTLILLAVISFTSTSAATKTQIIIFFSIFLSLISIFIGEYTPQVNPNSVNALPFWVAFSMFFPATTGIEAGMSMSGDLKNPSKSLPIGTMLSILTAYLTYSFLAFFLHKNLSYQQLFDDPLILPKVAKVGIFVIFGIWGATVSSALGSMLGAPRTMQALAKDGILPQFLAKGYGEMNLPRVATILAFVFALMLTLAADINQIIPILTMICLVFYSLLNFVSFFESFLQNPSWRPGFVTPWYVSLAGMCLCIVVMLLVNPQACLTLLAFVIALNLILGVKKVSYNLDDIRYSIFSFIVRFGMEKLKLIKINAKSWRPHILAISNSTDTDQPLISFADAINGKRGFFTFSSLIPEIQHIEDIQKKLSDALHEKQCNCFVHVKSSPSIYYETQQLIKHYGIGPIRSNTLILPHEGLGLDYTQLTQIIFDAIQSNKNVMLFKSPTQLLTPFTQVTKKIPKSIDLWWGGSYRKNLDFSLAIVQLLIKSPIWKNTKITIRSLVKSASEKAEILTKGMDYLNILRIKNITFDPLVSDDADFYSTIEKQGKNSAHLTFLGLRIPKFDESPLVYAQYLQNVLSQTSNLQNVIYVLAGERMNFLRIFENKQQ